MSGQAVNRRAAATGPGRLALIRRGSGEPCVLLHPLALAGELWMPQAERLAGEFDVIAPDLRGHGDSDWDGGPFTIDELAEDLAATLDSLALDSVHLLGMSMGGSVAMTFAGAHPTRVRSLVLADTTAWYGPDAPSTWAQRARQASSVPRVDQLPFQLDRWFSADFRSTHPSESVRVADIFLRTRSGAHAAAATAMGQLDARPLLPAITAPTLVLVGEHDYATPPAMAAALAEAIPDASLRVLPELRHLSLIEQPGLIEPVRQHLRAAASEIR